MVNRDHSRFWLFIALNGFMTYDAFILMLCGKIIHSILCNLFKPLLIEFESDIAHIRTFLPGRLPRTMPVYPLMN